MKMVVTIRVERSDGQFTVAQTEVPAVLPEGPHEQQALRDRVADGFVRAYRDCADLPR